MANQHFRFIELLAYWQGAINSTDVSLQFSISIEQAQKYLSHYRSQYPNRLMYSSSQKRFTLQDDTGFTYITKNAADYLDWLYQPSSVFSEVPSPVFTERVVSPKRNVSPKVMAALIDAIKHKMRLDVDYVSLSNPSVDGRVIQPLKMVKTGMRWHLRAYDEKHLEFRDFVLNRFKGQPELLDKQTTSLEKDTNWQRKVTLTFAPDPRLTEQQKQVIFDDYNMTDGMLNVQTRGALVQYVLQEMQFNATGLHMEPEGQQIVLQNFSEIKQWLF